MKKNIIKDMNEEVVNTEVYPNGSMLSPETLTTCNTCGHFESGERKECSECNSTDVEVIREGVEE